MSRCKKKLLYMVTPSPSCIIRKLKQHSKSSSLNISEKEVYQRIFSLVSSCFDSDAIDLVQFRDKLAEDHTSTNYEYCRQLAQDISRLCKSKEIPFIVNDHLELAIEIKADGVHLGQSDSPIERLRDWKKGKFGNDAFPFGIGVTVKTIEQALEASREGASSLGIGPIYPTVTKNNPGDVKGISGLRSIVEAVRKDGNENTLMFAIGGINTPINCFECVSHGMADGVAVVSGLIKENDIISPATKDIHEILSTRASQLKQGVAGVDVER